MCTIRQSAGHGNVIPPLEERRAVVEKLLSEHQRSQISYLARKQAALNAPDGRTGHYKSRNTFADPPTRRRTPTGDYRVRLDGHHRGRRGDDDCSGSWTGLRPTRSIESRDERHLDKGMPFKWPEPAVRRSMFDFTGEHSEELSSMLRNRRTDPKCVSLAQLYGRSTKSRDDKSDEPPSNV